MLQIILMLLTFATIAEGDFRPQTFVVNLNDPPEVRWIEISTHFKDYGPTVLNITRQFIPKTLERIMFYVAEKFEHFFTPEIAGELRGIANGSGLPLGDVVLLNLIYDFTVFNRPNSKKLNQGCTSIIAQDSEGNIWHGRNLDYPLRDILENVTMIVEFKQHNQTVFTSVSFAFWAGVITGQRPGAFAISLNERDSGAWWFNLLMALFTEMRYPISFAVRHVLQYETSFISATKKLSQIYLMAPCYLIISGTKPGEGIILTRDRLSTVNFWYLNPTLENWYLVETNYDHWKEAGDKRREVAIKALNETGPKKINSKTMFDILSKYPVYNKITWYTSILSAGHPLTLYQYTFIRSNETTKMFE